MLNLPFLNKRHVCVLGLGKTGNATLKAIASSGALVSATDDHPEALKHARSLLEKNPSPWNRNISILPPDNIDFQRLHEMVISPGIPYLYDKKHRLIKKALGFPIQITSDTDLYFRTQPKGLHIGISGTNGKSSTTDLLYHILSHSYRNTVKAGNIGIPILSLNAPSRQTVSVLELSSYQLDITPSLTLDAGILLNITPDHLERYQDFSAYKQSKFLLLKSVKKKGMIFYNADDPYQKEWINENTAITQKRRLIPLSLYKPQMSGFALIGHTLYQGSKIQGLNNSLCTEETLSLSSHPSIRRDLCFLATFACARLLGLQTTHTLTAATSWPGLPHRLESVQLTSKIHVVNDSKATNIAAAVYALNTMVKTPILWLCGGVLKKGDDLDALSDCINNVQHAFCFGQDRDKFALFLKHKNKLYETHASMDAAVKAAMLYAGTKFAKNNANLMILFSPGGSSFDAFKNFEERGNAFKTWLARYAHHLHP